jgi:hypothetical protein
MPISIQILDDHWRITCARGVYLYVEPLARGSERQRRARKAAGKRAVRLRRQDRSASGGRFQLDRGVNYVEKGRIT